MSKAIELMDEMVSLQTEEVNGHVIVHHGTKTVLDRKLYKSGDDAQKRIGANSLLSHMPYEEAKQKRYKHIGKVQTGG